MSTITRTAASRSATTVAPVTSATAATTAGSASSPRSPTHILIDGRWYDLTHWKTSHPGGALILEQIDGQDATDAFYSLHSAEAIARLKRLPSSTTIPARLADRPPAAPTAATVAFRQFRKQLQEEGFFDRSPFWESFYTLFVYTGVVLGSLLAYSGQSVLSILVSAITMQQAGWIGHDYTHARGKLCYYNGLLLSTLTNGFSRSWWSNKHNTHHVFTNYIGVDSDIENDPVFHLFFPDPKDDTLFRKMQHWYFVPVASVLYISWKVQSLQYALKRWNVQELALMVIHYAWMYTLGIWIALPAVYIAGGLVAVIVTATHQSEEMIDAPTHSNSSTGVIPYSFVEGQFATTRDAKTNNFFMEFLWGGMQYQLEHHLFPIMPKYYYAAVAPKVKAFAQKNGLSYRCDTQMQILLRNFNTLKYFAQAIDPTKAQ